MQASGIDVFDFSLGEPDQPTPEHISRAAADAVRAGHTHYTPVAGIPEARSAIARRYEKMYGVVFDPSPAPKPTRLMLVRHAVTAQTGPLLSGRTPGIDLSDRGRE